MNKLIALLCCVLLSFNAHSTYAQESPDSSLKVEKGVSESTENDATKSDLQVARSVIQLETSAVKGSQELPKVLVIVPWKSAQVVENEDRPLASLVEEVLSPLDPAVFRRQTNYYNSLQQPDDEKAPAK